MYIASLLMAPNYIWSSPVTRHMWTPRINESNVDTREIIERAALISCKPETAGRVIHMVPGERYSHSHRAFTVSLLIVEHSRMKHKIAHLQQAITYLPTVLSYMVILAIVTVPSLDFLEILVKL